MVEVLGEQFSVIGGLGAGGGWTLFISLAVYVVRKIVVGDLVPRRLVEDQKAAEAIRSAALATDRDTWKHAFIKRGEVIAALQRQTDKMLALSETSAHVLTSLPQVEEEADNDA